ncbi:hypothetical protein ACFSTC_27035 [Nonomuraea ferruginea]
MPYCLGLTWAARGLPGRAAGWGGWWPVAGWRRSGWWRGAGTRLPWSGCRARRCPTSTRRPWPPSPSGSPSAGRRRCWLSPLRRLLARPAAWAAVAAVNLAAMTVFLWHQTAMIAVTVAGLHAGGRLPGLHTAPDGLGWVAARLAWLPAFAVALALCCLLFHTYERSSVRAPRRRVEP